MAAKLGLTQSVGAELQQVADLRKNMRKALYAELAFLYEIIEPLQSKTSNWEGSAVIVRAVKISTYLWAKSQPDIFYELPEAAHVDRIYRTIGFIHSQFILPGLAKETMRLGAGFVLALEATVTATRCNIDTNLFEQISPSVYKRIVMRSTEEKRPRKLLAKIDALTPKP